MAAWGLLRSFLTYGTTSGLLRWRELLNHDPGHGVPPGLSIFGTFTPAISYVYSHSDGPRGNSLAETSNLSCFIVSIVAILLKGVIKSEVFWQNENSVNICSILNEIVLIFSFPGSTWQERPQLNKIKTGMLEVLVERFLCALKSFFRIYEYTRCGLKEF